MQEHMRFALPLCHALTEKEGIIAKLFTIGLCELQYTSSKIISALNMGHRGGLLDLIVWHSNAPYMWDGRICQESKRDGPVVVEAGRLLTQYAYKRCDYQALAFFMKRRDVDLHVGVHGYITMCVFARFSLFVLSYICTMLRQTNKATPREE